MINEIKKSVKQNSAVTDDIKIIKDYIVQNNLLSSYDSYIKRLNGTGNNTTFNYSKYYTFLICKYFLNRKSKYFLKRKGKLILKDNKVNKLIIRHYELFYIFLFQINQI